MERLLQDLRFAARGLIKAPGFALAAVITLALGIGANSAVFSVVNALLLRPLPYPNSERLVHVWRTEQADPTRELPFSPPNFTDLRNRCQSFDSFFCYSYVSFTLTGDGAPDALSGVTASADFGRVIGTPPALGRVFAADEDQPGKNHVAIISDGLWKRRFAANPQVVGQEIQLNGEPYEIIGVMPPEFRFPNSTIEVWTPIALDISKFKRGTHFLSTLARLKPGVSIAQARAELQNLGEQFTAEFPDFGRNAGFNPEPLREHLVGDIEKPLMILFGAVVIVLVIGCVNVANLMLGRATARWKEIAVRSALGASRTSLVRLLMTESGCVAVIGGAAGLLLAMYGVEALTAINPDAIPNREGISVDGFVVGFTFLISLATGLLFGLAPALQATKIDLSQALRESSRSSTGARRLKTIRSGLVVSEISLSLVLLVSAGLLSRSFWKLLQVNPGFQAENVVTCPISLPQTRYPKEWQQADFFRRTLEQVRQIPGVQSAGFATSLPFSGSRGHSSFAIDANPTPPDVNGPEANRHQIAPGYFAAMGIPLLAGRDFTDSDDIPHAGVVIINQACANRYWPDLDPVGERLTIGMGQEVSLYGKPVSREIVGVVGNVKHEALREEPQPEMYIPAFQLPALTMTLIVRGGLPAETLVTGVRRAVQSIDREQPIRRAQLLTSAIARSTAEQRFTTTLLLVFGGIALMLALVGIYGVLSYSVTQRTQEMGIRMALGANRRDVQRLVIRQGLTLALIGAAIGSAASLAATRLMSSLLFGISAADPITFSAVLLGMLVVSFAACYVPARRAAGVNPIVALHYE